MRGRGLCRAALGDGVCASAPPIWLTDMDETVRKAGPLQDLGWSFPKGAEVIEHGGARRVALEQRYGQCHGTPHKSSLAYAVKMFIRNYYTNKKYLDEQMRNFIRRRLHNNYTRLASKLDASRCWQKGLQEET